jgi:paraquat-inducible protein B
MGSKANPTIIGAFVVGAVVLLVVGVLLFSGGTFFTRKNTFVMYFDAAVTGLSVGAPVRFRGVQIGEVSEIVALYDSTNDDILIEVLVEITPGHITDIATRTAVRPTSPAQDIVNALVKRGMRASLQVQSMVTGLLYVELDFHPDTPVKLLGLNGQYVELPTVPSTMEQLFANVKSAIQDLGKLPLDQLLKELIATFDRVNAILNAPEMDRALANIGTILEDARHLLDDVSAQASAFGKKLGRVEDETSAMLQAARATLLDTQKLVRNVNGQVAPLADSAKGTLSAARSALRQGQKTLVNLENAATPALGQAEKTLAAAANVAGPDSVVLNDLSRTLREFEEAARSIRGLADALQRNPEALLRGKGR